MIYAVNKQTKEHVVFRGTGELPYGHWGFIEADADGWIDFHGGECPLPDDQLCELKFGYFQYISKVMPAGYLKWAWERRDITAYRPIIEPQAPEWNGEGLPPVGTVCEGYVQDSDRTWRWLKVEILKQHNIPQNECAVHVTNHAILRWCDQFRPIRTDREKWIDQAADVVLKGGDALNNIYDALKSGELPQP